VIIACPVVDAVGRAAVSGRIQLPREVVVLGVPGSDVIEEDSGGRAG
jgi:hypothetical protein